MHRYLVFLFLFLSGCSTVSKVASETQPMSDLRPDITLQGPSSLRGATADGALSFQATGTPDKIVAPSLLDKYRNLGQFYRQRYVSDLVFSAVVDSKKLLVSRRLLKSFATNGIANTKESSAEVDTSFDPKTKSSSLEVALTPPRLNISKPSLFYSSIVSSPELMHFTGDSKLGTWWAFIDSSKLLTWEAYFWMAYFIDNGYTAEYSPELNMLILGSFSNFEEAKHLKSQFRDAPISVAFVILDSNPFVSDAVVQPAQMSTIPSLEGVTVEKIK